MATTTQQKEMTKNELERKRSALVLRKRELEEAIENSPAEMAMKREKWFRSESAADERALHKSKQALTTAEDELVEVDACIVIVEALLAEELRKEQAARDAELRAEADSLVEA